MSWLIPICCNGRWSIDNREDAYFADIIATCQGGKEGYRVYFQNQTKHIDTLIKGIVVFF